MIDDIEDLRITGIVRKVLLEHSQCRDDDQILIDFVEREAHHLFISRRGGLYTPEKHLCDRFKPEFITRLKRKLMELERDSVKDPTLWRIQSSETIRKLKDKEMVAMREYMVGSWSPVLSGVSSKQTVLMED